MTIEVTIKAVPKCSTMSSVSATRFSVVKIALLRECSRVLLPSYIYICICTSSIAVPSRTLGFRSTRHIRTLQKVNTIEKGKCTTRRGDPGTKVESQLHATLQQVSHHIRSLSNLTPRG